MAISIICIILFIVLGPLVGGLADGLDRKFTARMQSRVGPPILQPFYDVKKLFSKERASVNDAIDYYVLMALVFMVVSGALFFSGGNLLMVFFTMALSEIFVVVAAYCSRSPYADAGGMREIILIAAYEPLIILLPIGVYMLTGSFDVSTAITQDTPLIAGLPFLFVGFVIVYFMKMRKSPFDVSVSHHAHQELVKGLTTEMSGRTFALYEIMHWYESTILVFMVGMFFVAAPWWTIIIALVAMGIVFTLGLLLDNSSARIKWQTMLWLTWAIVLVLFIVNVLFLNNAYIYMIYY